MFAIISRDTTIGHSALERGDPPMGVAFGTFIPAAGFPSFLADVRPSQDSAELQTWYGLLAVDSEGVELSCLGVGLCRYMTGSEVSLDVEVVGMDLRQYERLFPHHVDSYRRRFRSPNT